MFSWLSEEEKERSLEGHTLKIEVMNGATGVKMFARYIHLNDYQKANIAKVNIKLVIDYRFV